MGFQSTKELPGIVERKSIYEASCFSIDAIKFIGARCRAWHCNGRDNFLVHDYDFYGEKMKDNIDAAGWCFIAWAGGYDFDTRNWVTGYMAFVTMLICFAIYFSPGWEE